MKLFDRSVDLAQFEQSTPLYPICRAWMQNQPHNRNLGTRERTPSPEPTEEEVMDVSLFLFWFFKLFGEFQLIGPWEMWQ